MKARKIKPNMFGLAQVTLTLLPLDIARFNRLVDAGVFKDFTNAMEFGALVSQGLRDCESFAIDSKQMALPEGQSLLTSSATK